MAILQKLALKMEEMHEEQHIVFTFKVVCMQLDYTGQFGAISAQGYSEERAPIPSVEIAHVLLGGADHDL